MFTSCCLSSLNCLPDIHFVYALIKKKQKKKALCSRTTCETIPGTEFVVAIIKMVDESNI